MLPEISTAQRLFPFNHDLMTLLQTLHTVQLEAVSSDVVHHDVLTLFLAVGITLLVQENQAGDDQTKQEPDDLTAPATIA